MRARFLVLIWFQMAMVTVQAQHFYGNVGSTPGAIFSIDMACQCEDCIEYEYFLKFKKRYSTMIPHRTEWRIFDEDYLIAGTIDMIYKKDDGSYYIFDWKRSEKVVNKDNSIKTSDPSHPYTKYAYGDLNHLTDDSYYKYALQQNIYRYILEKKYGYRISSLNLLILHPSYDTFHWLKLPEMKTEVEYMFSTLKIIS